MRHPILFVEDHEETRALFAELLRSEGYEVVEARDAASGLGELRTSRFSLVLSDYWLDNGDTGLQMIERARRDGLLDGVPVILCTAERSVHGLPADIPVLRKPVDVTALLSLVTKMSSASNPPPVATPHARPLHPPPSSRALLDRSAAAPAPVDLVFYISQSPVSAKALRTLMASLARYQQDAFRLSVIDLSADPSSPRAIEDRVALTPMLVAHAAGKRERLVGEFDDPAVLEDVLERAGLALREA